MIPPDHTTLTIHYHTGAITARVPVGGSAPCDVDALMAGWYDTDEIGIARRIIKRELDRKRAQDIRRHVAKGSLWREAVVI